MFKFELQRFAHKKGVSSTRNGRDSESKRLGVKEHAGTIAATEVKAPFRAAFSSWNLA